MEQVIVPYTSMEHRQLSFQKNHKISTTHTGEVIWMMKLGIRWIRNMQMKEFRDTQQAYNWMRDAVKEHYKKSFYKPKEE